MYLKLQHTTCLDQQKKSDSGSGFQPFPSEKSFNERYSLAAIPTLLRLSWNLKVGVELSLSGLGTYDWW